MKEIFKDIPGYEGLYQVSNLGNVLSLRYNRKRLLKSRINMHGYYVIDLSVYKDPKTWQIHQLVAICFLGHKPNGYKAVVNHINLNKKDNNVNNLEIISQRQNTNRQHMNDYCKTLGLSYNRSRNKLQCKIVINSFQVHLGYFTLEEEEIGGIYYKIALDNISLYNNNTDDFRNMIKMKFQESLINKAK